MEISSKPHVSHMVKNTPGVPIFYISLRKFTGVTSILELYDS